MSCLSHLKLKFIWVINLLRIKILFILLIFRDEIVLKKDLVDPITAHKGLTVCKYKESNLGPVTGFRALAKRLYSEKTCT